MITARVAKKRQFELKLFKDYFNNELSKIDDSIYIASGQGLGFTHHDLYIDNFQNNLVHDVVTRIYNVLTNMEYNYEVDIHRHISHEHGDYYRLIITWNKMNKE